MTRDDVFNQDLNEKDIYETATEDQTIKLPLTKMGFDSLLHVVCNLYNLPEDDGARSVLAGYIHHIANDVHTTTIATIGHVIHKSIANHTSWIIDQEIKIKRRNELEAARAAEVATTETQANNLSLVETPTQEGA